MRQQREQADLANPASYEAQAARLAKQKFKLRERMAVGQAYRRLLCDTEGNLNADAKLVLGDLAKAAKMGRVTPEASNEALREQAGMRAIVLHIFARLDPEALGQIAQSLEGK